MVDDSVRYIYSLMQNSETYQPLSHSYYSRVFYSIRTFSWVSVRWT